MTQEQSGTGYFSVRVQRLVDQGLDSGLAADLMADPDLHVLLAFERLPKEQMLAVSGLARDRRLRAESLASQAASVVSGSVVLTEEQEIGWLTAHAFVVSALEELGVADPFELAPVDAAKALHDRVVDGVSRTAHRVRPAAREATREAIACELYRQHLVERNKVPRRHLWADAGAAQHQFRERAELVMKAATDAQH